MRVVAEPFDGAGAGACRIHTHMEPLPYIEIALRIAAALGLGAVVGVEHQRPRDERRAQVGAHARAEQEVALRRVEQHPRVEHGLPAAGIDEEIGPGPGRDADRLPRRRRPVELHAAGA